MNFQSLQQFLIFKFKFKSHLTGLTGADWSMPRGGSGLAAGARAAADAGLQRGVLRLAGTGSGLSDLILATGSGSDGRGGAHRRGGAWSPENAARRCSDAGF